MKTNFNLSIILPIKTSIARDFEELFKKSIESITTQDIQPEELIIVHTNEELLKTYLNDFDFGDLNVRKLEFNGEPNFSDQVNFGIENSKTEWVTILEFDDEYSKIWFDNTEKYIKAYEDVDVFLPIVLDVDTNGRFLHFTNEPVWAKEFSDKLGFLDNDSLLNFPNFQLSGAVIKVETFKAVGGLKPNIKLHFVYEFLLRMTYYDKKIMTLPKLGYKKTNMRPDSLFFNYYTEGSEKIDVIEARFWFNTARKECYFKAHRSITFERETATIA